MLKSKILSNRANQIPLLSIFFLRKKAMAEAVVSIALETFRDLLLEEGRFLFGVGDEVKALEKQLKEIKCFLEDADIRRHESRSVANCISEIRDLAYRAEAAIELHAASASRRRRRRIRRSCCILEECYSIHQVGSEVSEIKSELSRISKWMQENGIQKSIINRDRDRDRDRDRGAIAAPNNNQAWLRKTFPNFEIGDCFVGMEAELALLDSLVVEDTEHRVVSVWGMGGKGKTTVAKKVYNNVALSFELSAWVCISQQCQIRSVLEEILKQLMPQTRDLASSLSDTELIGRLCDVQREKRCLVVLDDLWRLSHWDGLKHAFLVRDLQSKILITTREQEVAEIGFAVELGLLNPDEAWELLKKKAFPDSDIPDEENLERIGKEMVRKCGYLPLAISLLGGVLRKKNSTTEWELVNKNIKAFIYGDEKEINGVLNLSYESLPYYLKPCFLSMGIFKEDETIVFDYLYGMWIAQGMISYENIQDNEETLTDIAERYLSELASRSIVQVETLHGLASKTKCWSCKLHDVIRELCLKLGKKEGFGLQTLEYQGGKFSALLLQEASSSHVKIRHLAIHIERESELEHDKLRIDCGEDTSKHLRSLNILNHVDSEAIEFPPQSIIDLHKFKLLRDLIIVGFKFEGRKLLKGIANLVHLRRLRLNACELDKLPSSISNFVYLDTLDLSGTKNVGVPNVLKKMFRLKHLHLPDYDNEIPGNHRLRLEGVDELESLLGLDSRVHDLKCMGKMKNLRHFAASIHDNESLSSTLNAITTNWNKLVMCMICIREGCELRTSDREELKKAFTCPRLYLLLINVKLGKKLELCESDFIISSELTILTLLECEIEDDPMGILGKLAHLKLLYLGSSSFVGEEMMCPSRSFPSLKKLYIYDLPNLREWRVEEGAMPLLSTLRISGCSRLEMLPQGVSSISTLQKLKIYGMPELGKRVSTSGEDFHKVRHIPSIIIY